MRLVQIGGAGSDVPAPRGATDQAIRGRDGRPWARMLELILQTCVNALVASSFTALVAVGLVLIFGVMGIVNFAHGELFMVGAFVVWYLFSVLGVPFLLAVAAAIAVVASIGAVMERFLFRPMRKNPLGGLIMSVGTLFILQVAALEFGGGTGRAKHVTPAWRGVVEVFGIPGVTVPVQRLAVIAVTVLLLGGLWLFLHRTKAGLALRACARIPRRPPFRASRSTASRCWRWCWGPGSPAEPAR